MEKEPKIAAFENGQLHILASESTSREVVLALPLSRLLVKIVRVGPQEDANELASPLLAAISPFPDEQLTVSCEVVQTSEEGSVVLAAAMPEGSADDLGEALDAAKLNVVKIDALVFGALRMMWSELAISDARRRLVILRSPDCVSLLVLDGDVPVSIRAIPDDSDLKRETWLSLLEAEDFAGPKELAETIDREIALDSALQGIRDRAAGDDSLNALPESWREVLNESRFKAKLIRNLSIAGGIWLLIMVVLFGVPFGYGLMKDHVDGLIKAHAAQFNAVKEKKAKTLLVRKYSDHSRGALEIMKAVSDRMPLGITLTDWRFAHDKGVTIRGEADDTSVVYEFKDQLVAMTSGSPAEPTEGEEPADVESGEAVFKVVNLGPLHVSGGKQRFEIECKYEEEAEQ